MADTLAAALLAHRDALVEALNGLLAQSGDPNAVTGEFDTAAGRARRILDAALHATAEATSAKGDR